MSQAHLNMRSSFSGGGGAVAAGRETKQVGPTPLTSPNTLMHREICQGYGEQAQSSHR